MMNWNEINSSDDLDRIKEESRENTVMIFKHSTRCSISSMALNRLERSWAEEEMACIKPYFLDLIKNRSVSNQVAEDFAVPHESPQVLIIRNGQAIYDDSHMGISYDNIRKFTNS